MVEHKSVRNASAVMMFELWLSLHMRSEGRRTQSVSGIMVDGAVVGEKFEYQEGMVKEQFFTEADMICLENLKVFRKIESGGEEIPGYDIYAIYENRVVKSFLPESLKTDFYAVSAENLILSMKKPFILNGELSASMVMEVS